MTRSQAPRMSPETVIVIVITRVRAYVAHDQCLPPDRACGSSVAAARAGPADEADQPGGYDHDACDEGVELVAVHPGGEGRQAASAGADGAAHAADAPMRPVPASAPAKRR